ncbi:MAG: hypothetical protein COX62_04320 [Deltaproteobacteria bacterium CG_4_10_14_0_2_um_filter_43_8]|nr:MAG: hypothetical protein COV43_06800 [Deltaproteobacteria bacterium CG11_big_fil_rev_8_21_14_0_20_42_23]PJA20620.1 MAG: hypothetical protein COX62_04320 [Deltaproteobacteria bacterium CG_4_10_14_0_2_um_filter_43_8]PJC65224.1 MAG: hypothetical protein CO021_00105 [Deltaproteobacteria bacterium CG_4_9_14_0_2_um_filter_42_21]
MKKIFSSLLLLFFLLSAQASHAAELKMLFWYPGGAGSTAQARPTLELFFDYLNKHIAPQKISGEYINTTQDGVTYIKREAPTLAIISYSTWVQFNRKIAAARPWLELAPLPHGKNKDVYQLLGTTSSIPAKTLIYSSEPLSKDFFAQHLFDLKSDYTLKETPQIFQTLKAIANKEKEGIVVLTSIESATFSMLKAAWTKQLKELALSKPIPTARVVSFSQQFPAEQKLMKALIQMNKDEEGKAILQELQISSFQMLE